LGCPARILTDVGVRDRFADLQPEVRDVAPDGAMSLFVAGRSVGLGSDLTDNLWVRPAGIA
jgi:hypothetical protein